MSSLAETCVASNQSKLARLSQGSPFWRFSTGLLLPTDDSPRLVRMKVAPALSQHDKVNHDILESFVTVCSGYVQGSTMTELCEQSGCQRFAFVRNKTAEFNAHFNRASSNRSALDLSDMPPGGWAMILDSARLHLSDDLILDMFFLGGDNGYPPGVEMMQDLPANPHLFEEAGIVKGPVMVFLAQWGDLNGFEIEAFLDMPAEVLSKAKLMRELITVVQRGIHRRYVDAGILCR